MNLHDLYLKQGPAYLKWLGAATGRNPKYLYQIATGRRTPSAQVAKELIAADKRLSMKDLFA